MTDSYSVLIFDLDNTLVLSDNLKTLRDARLWGQVLRSLDQTTIPAGTLLFLEKIRRDYEIPIAIVTRAPRHYAEGLLRHHAINFDVLIAYHDVKRTKPDPEGVLLVAEKLGTNSRNCIYIGDPDGGVDRQTALNSGSTYIEIDWNSQKASWDNVMAVIERLLNRPNSSLS